MSISRLLIYWIGALPLIVWNWGYERPKVLWFLAGSFFVFLHSLRNRKQLAKHLNKADILFLLWLAVLLASGFTISDPLKGIIGGSYRYQGVLFFFALWMLGKTLKELKEGQKKLLIKIISAVTIFEAVLIIFQKFLAPETLIFGRPLGTFGEANAVGGFLTVSAIFVGVTPALILIAVATILTYSRASIFSLLIVGFGFILKNRKLPIKKVFLLGIIALTAIIFVFTKVGTTRLYSKFENRPLFWEMAVKFIKERPILGYGAESQETLYNIEYARREMPLSGLIIDRTHNLLLDIAVWSGALGLFLFIGWVLTESLNLFRKRMYLNLFGISALIVFSMFQPLGVVHWVLLVTLFNVNLES